MDFEETCLVFFISFMSFCLYILSGIPLGSVWRRKIKNRIELNKLILYVNLNTFYLFSCKILRNFDYILFSFLFFRVKPNIRKSFYLIYIFLFLVLFGFQTES